MLSTHKTLFFSAFLACLFFSTPAFTAFNRVTGSSTHITTSETPIEEHEDETLLEFRNVLSEALDQLDDDFSAELFSWLLKSLPPTLKLLNADDLLAILHQISEVYSTHPTDVDQRLFIPFFESWSEAINPHLINLTIEETILAIHAAIALPIDRNSFVPIVLAVVHNRISDLSVSQLTGIAFLLQASDLNIKNKNIIFTDCLKHIKNNIDQCNIDDLLTITKALTIKLDSLETHQEFINILLPRFQIALESQNNHISADLLIELLQYMRSLRVNPYTHPALINAYMTQLQNSLNQFTPDELLCCITEIDHLGLNDPRHLEIISILREQIEISQNLITPERNSPHSPQPSTPGAKNTPSRNKGKKRVHSEDTQSPLRKTKRERTIETEKLEINEEDNRLELPLPPLVPQLYTTTLEEPIGETPAGSRMLPTGGGSGPFGM